MQPNKDIVFTDKKIVSWKQFGKHVRIKGCHLLKSLEDFNASVLVAGCQRSGTTAVARIITSSDGMVNYWFGKDDELDAALILSGEVAHEPSGRYCFQTTYLNQCYKEYEKYKGTFYLIWIVRNPYSVIYSMLNNWGRFAFNELFDACGSTALSTRYSGRYGRFGQISVPRIIRACCSYNAKTSQILELKSVLPAEKVLILDYDDLVNNVETKLEELYKFIDLEYQPHYSEKLHVTSLNKARRLSVKDKLTIHEVCDGVYQKVRSLAI